MGYSTQAQVEMFSQAKNRFAYDSSSATVTAQNIVDENGYTVGAPATLSLINVEKLIDNAVNDINTQAGTSIAAMTGVAGSKSLSCTRTESNTVKSVTSLFLRMLLKTGATNYSIGGLSANTVANDSGYSIAFDTANKSIQSLKSAVLFKDVTFNYANAVAKYIAVADSKVDVECQVPRGFFAAGGYTVTDEYHDGTELQRSIIGFTGQQNASFNSNRDFILKTFLHPVLSVTVFSEETSTGVWTARVENTDYIVVKDGVRFIKNVPRSGYRNIKLTYTAGYAAVPEAVSNVSAVLAAQIMNAVISASNPVQQEAKK